MSESANLVEMQKTGIHRHRTWMLGPSIISPGGIKRGQTNRLRGASLAFIESETDTDHCDQ